MDKWHHVLVSENPGFSVGVSSPFERHPARAMALLALGLVCVYNGRGVAVSLTLVRQTHVCSALAIHPRIILHVIGSSRVYGNINTHAHKRRTRTGGAQHALVDWLRFAGFRINGNNGRRANTYHHRDESTAIERSIFQ